jgi:hypothetical protein
MVIGEHPVRLGDCAAALAGELDWLATAIAARLQELGRSAGERGMAPLQPRAPPPLAAGTPHAVLVEQLGLDADERLVLALALAPHVRPAMLDPLFAANAASGRGHTEVGGLQGRSHGGFLPTGETALFLLAGADLARRFACRALFDPDAPLFAEGLVQLDGVPAGEPLASGALTAAEELVDLLTSGLVRRPRFGRAFPARRLEATLAWDDLVLAPDTMAGLRELDAWVRHEGTIMAGWRLDRWLRPGYRALFHGPSGTGKTLTATLLGQRVGREVYRVDLSAVVSKYIGDTEKNLERVFARAQRRACILFFDEADALFGRRTAVGDAHDRYANQEVSYLLQRVEDFPGVAILATNLENNIDDAFLRRFQAVVHFPLPGPEERLRLWARALPAQCPLDPQVRLDEIASRYELAGGAIVNVVRYAALMALDAEASCISRRDLLAGIRRELHKEGRSL